VSKKKENSLLSFVQPAVALAIKVWSNSLLSIISFLFHLGVDRRGPVKEILVLEQVCLRWPSKHFWRKNLVKSVLISTLDKVIYYKGTFLQGSTKPHFTRQNKLETSWKKVAPFSTFVLLQY
jgi:hypothetical protein